MRDKVLAYALAASVGLHLLIFIVVGKTSAARHEDVKQAEYIQVDVVKSPDEPKPAPVEIVKPAPKPEPVQPETVETPIPEPVPTPTPKPQPVSKPTPKPAVKTNTPHSTVQSPVYSNKPVKVASNKLPGNPGGTLDLGSGSSRGQDLGASGHTPTGWVPGSESGTGIGSGSGPGVGKPEPTPGAVEGPGREPAPPPPPPDVDVKVCAESGMLPGSNCERTTIKSFRPGKEPERVCTDCKPKHVSTLADRSTPELISGPKRPKYPASAKEQGIEGSVTVEYTIDTDGKVVGVKISSSSGNSSLDDAASETVKSRKYKPAVQAGIPRNYRKRETFHFALD